MSNSLSSGNPNPTVNSGNPNPKDRSHQTDEEFKAAIQAFFSGAATIATFFAGFTLNIVVSADTKGRRHVRLWAAISSILFVNAALLSISFGVIVAFYQGRLLELLRIAREGAGPQGTGHEADFRALKFWVLLPAIGLYVMLVAGVIFFLLVVYSYEQGVGIAGFVVAGLGSFVGGFWLFTILGLMLFNRKALDAPF